MTEPMELQRSSRSPELLRGRLQAWLRDEHPDATITEIHGTAANGASSETLLFDATWTHQHGPQLHRLVARVAPDPDDVPVFPSYDLTRQFEIIRLVGEQTTVPIPRVFRNEPSAEPLGTPFFVMERVEGEVPPDVLPYNFGDNWLFDATREQQRALQDASVDLLVALHDMPVPDFLQFDAPGDTALRRHVAHTRAWYDYVAADGPSAPLVETTFDWLAAHWPDESPSVVSWGDARIGNVLYRDFAPVAVLDWEMCGVAPREIDLGWMIYAHRSFEDIARSFELPGMPHFMRRDDVVERYAAGSGYEPRDLDFYETYAALQWAIVFLRTGARRARFGEIEMPADPAELIMNRASLEAMLDGAGA
jgi:aminoglycoside phosphotransferase (APT) family kinase protein